VTVTQECVGILPGVEIHMGNESSNNTVDHYIDDDNAHFQEPILKHDKSEKHIEDYDVKPYKDKDEEEGGKSHKDKQETDEKKDRDFCGYCSHCFDSHINQPNKTLYYKVCTGECNTCKKKHIVLYKWNKEQQKVIIMTPPGFVNTFM